MSIQFYKQWYAIPTFSAILCGFYYLGVGENNVN